VQKNIAILTIVRIILLRIVVKNSVHTTAGRVLQLSIIQVLDFVLNLKHDLEPAKPHFWPCVRIILLLQFDKELRQGPLLYFIIST
jgi:hypothetical protein